MSHWGATVITNLLSAIPFIGQDIVPFIWGGFSVSNPTIQRFFALHYLLPFILAALVVMHFIALHTHGSSNPVGISGNLDRIPMHSYFLFKVRRCGVFLQLLQNNKYFVIILPSLDLGNMWKHLLNRACLEKDLIIHIKIVIKRDSDERSMVRIILFKHQLPMLLKEGDRHAINGTLIYLTDTGFEGICNTKINSNYSNSIIKVVNDEPKDLFWEKYITTGFASSSNRYANRGSILAGSVMKYNRGNSLWSTNSAQWREPTTFSQRMFSTRAGSSKNVLNSLDSLRARSKENPNSIIDRQLYKTFILNKDLLRTAYEKLKSKPGMMTPGINPTTLDGMSEERLDKIIMKLKDNSFQFSPGKRITIPKDNGKLRPLTLGSPEDKLVQEVIRMVLEAIYEPLFLDVSHGFRPNRSCHSALRKIFTTFKGCTWWIEGDIKACFDEIPHDKLIELLSNKISDQRFIELIRKSLNAGYLYKYIRKTDIIGTPQGSIISPILANIYLHQLDLFILKLKDEFDFKGKYSFYDSKYRSIQHRLHRARKLGENSFTLRKLAIELRGHNRDYKNEFTRKLQYIRYADDWIIAINGSYNDTKLILNKISDFCLNELGLTVSSEKTKITNSYKDRILFLGTYIKHSSVTTYSLSGKYIKRNSGFLVLSAPMDIIKSKLVKAGFISRQANKHIGISRNTWLSLKPQQIIHLANSIIRGYLNYYSFVFNKSQLTGYIFYVIRDVVLRTFAHKYRLGTRAKVYHKFGKNLQIRDLVNRNKDNTPRVLATFFKPENYKLNVWDFKNKVIDTNVPSLYSETISLASVMKAKCLICTSDYRVEMHHIRMMKDLKVIKGTLDYLMAKANRKQLPLCRSCHMKYHAGKLTIPHEITARFERKSKAE